MTIATAPFGRTGHDSSRVIFGAAALAQVTQQVADETLEVLVAHGVNHLDTASSYGDAELRMRPWLVRDPGRFFVATKTDDRTAAGAREDLHRSLERLGVDHVDLWQLRRRARRRRPGRPPARSRRRTALRLIVPGSPAVVAGCRLHC